MCQRHMGPASAGPGPLEDGPYTSASAYERPKSPDPLEPLEPNELPVDPLFDPYVLPVDPGLLLDPE